MKKAITFLATGIIGVMCAYGVFTFLQNTYDERVIQTQNSLPPLPCSLNKQRCFVHFKDKQIGFEATPRPINFMEPTTITISGLAHYDDVKLRIYGLNMEMGTLIANAHKNGTSYSAKVALNACLLETMRYRISVYNGNEPLGLYIDFDLER